MVRIALLSIGRANRHRDLGDSALTLEDPAGSWQNVALGDRERTRPSLEGWPRATRSIEPLGPSRRRWAASAITDVAVPNPRSPLRRQGRRVDELRGWTMESAEARGKHSCSTSIAGSRCTPTWGCEAHGGSPSGAPPAIDARGSCSRCPVPRPPSSMARIWTSEPRPSCGPTPNCARLAPDVLAQGFDAAGGRGGSPAPPTSPARSARYSSISGCWRGSGTSTRARDAGRHGSIPWRALSDLEDDDAPASRDRDRGLMRVRRRDRADAALDLPPAGQPCPRCGTRNSSRGQGDANRATYWCGSCQGADRPGALHNRRVREEG